jgi:hypothetical protein
MFRIMHFWPPRVTSNGDLASQTSFVAGISKQTMYKKNLDAACNDNLFHEHNEPEQDSGRNATNRDGGQRTEKCILESQSKGGVREG